MATAAAKEEIHILPPGVDLQKCVEAWTAGLNLKRGLPVNRMRQAFLDTFDGKLRKKGLVLERQGKRYRLYSRENGELLREAVLKVSRKKLFAKDFPSGGFRDQVESVIGVRALLPFVSAHRSIQPLRIMDNKAEAGRLLIETVEPIDPQLKEIPMRWLRLLPGKEVSEALAQLRQRLGLSGLKPDARPAVSILLAALDVSPAVYSSKITVSLDPKEPALEALIRILRPLLEIMKQNEAGILAEIDSEFLHDFRVSIRRTRSALSQVKGVFSQAAVDSFRQDFALLQKITGPTRDLDVWLQKERLYQDMVPEGLKTCVSEFFQELAGERRTARRKMVKHIRKGAYRKIMSSWEHFLFHPSEGRNAARPIIRIARKRIYKGFRRVLQHGRLVGEPPEDRKMHLLRIECKKLRYLLEFFRCLFPAEKTEGLVSQLRKLQDHLGEMNDLSVEKESLGRRLEKVAEEDREGNRTATLGMLIALMHRRHGQLLRGFAERFEAFSCPCSRKLYQELFTQRKNGKTAAEAAGHRP